MLSILLDSKSSPEHFSWFGAIELSSIKEWATNSRLEFPEDLLDFWSQTGGGDCFESETFFRPTDQPSNAPYFIEGDDFRSANDHRLKNGMPIRISSISGWFTAVCDLSFRSNLCRFE
jgi:hypothetical protein